MPKGKEGFPHQQQLQRFPRGILECNHQRQDGTRAIGQGCPHPRWGLHEVEGPEGRIICHEHLLALGGGVGPMGMRNSSGDAVDKEVGPLDIFV